MTSDKRPEPESFLDLVPRGQKGRLKVYLGAAAGVGKTYRMLEEAHELRARGVDVVLALIETHGRAETAERIGELEMIPRKRVDYRGIAPGGNGPRGGARAQARSRDQLTNWRIPTCPARAIPNATRTSRICWPREST